MTINSEKRHLIINTILSKCYLIVITLNCDATFIVNVFGGKNNVVMLISKSIIEEFEYNIICDSTLFYFSTINFTNYSLRAKRLLYTFLGSIFAVSYIAISIVRILTGLCFLGTPPPLSGGFRLGYFHAYRVQPVSTSMNDIRRIKNVVLYCRIIY